MEDKKMEELMIDYIDGRLTGELKSFVEKHITKTEENRREYESLKKTVALINADREHEPDSSLKLDFLNNLEEAIESESGKKRRVVKLRSENYWQIAAAVALLAVGILGGMWFNQNQEKQAQMLAMQEEVEATKRMVMLALDNQNSASERMMGVNASYELSKADTDIINALVKTMNEDDNVNVRLAAINALSKFSDQPHVRSALIASLEKQRDAIVQITLINLMVEMKERGAINELKEMIEDSTNIESVKDEAHMAVFKLS
ncbi:hypothetical protein E1176_12320 [Fulvivirga sp. RKSG066]|uniref:HEAT repeat domain-containing protein n=1 Tax=Fulvivirga aurantia TaxID=2529383 RepID=UPI0012BB8AE1|nr:HEAT repeat domain-containing protein [Fulvivirga aurantia]MTI21808.1 hypothetical protein [Fulvivirga aurantia]